MKVVKVENVMEEVDRLIRDRKDVKIFFRFHNSEEEASETVARIKKNISHEIEGNVYVDKNYTVLVVKTYLW